MAKVVHRVRRSDTLTTRFGALVVDADGVCEVSEEVAAVLCDPTVYGTIFTRLDAPKLEEDLELESEDEITPMEGDQDEEPSAPKRRTAKKVALKKRVKRTSK